MWRGALREGAVSFRAVACQREVQIIDQSSWLESMLDRPAWDSAALARQLKKGAGAPFAFE